MGGEGAARQRERMLCAGTDQGAKASENLAPAGLLLGSVGGVDLWLRTQDVDSDVAARAGSRT